MKLIHVVAGLLALASGAVALYAAKGSTLHRKGGLIFVVAMLVMTASAVVMATFLRPHTVNAVAGVLTFYLVSTGLLTVRCGVDEARALATGFMLVALTAGAFALRLGFAASAGGDVDGIPAPPIFMFAAVGLLGAWGDARMLWSGRIEGPRRIARHLWRMTFAMWIATTSFFLGQAKFFPEPLRRNIGLRAIPVVLVLATLVYWLARVLIKRRRALPTTEPAR